MGMQWGEMENQPYRPRPSFPWWMYVAGVLWALALMYGGTGV